MNFSTRSEGEVTIVAFSGPVDFGDALRFAGEFRTLVAAGRRSFVFDFLKLTYIDSTLIAETIACLKRVRERSGDIKFVSRPGSKVHDILHITALDRVLDLHETVEAAVSSLTPSP